ncbi:glycosyltransferase family 4 protein [Geobacter chapellei]|uniref:Glycosyltransferase family 4 protein n=2 Tax=Pelotalea chapellei TaxID=44671 RepID=A0ABS5UA47_9BACT|nr:glycosyltransferase family 4 protein [Pelotalea chapellei]
MLAPTPYFADRGCHVRIYEEARALIELGCQVHIVTYHIGRDMSGIPTVRIPQVSWYRRLTAGPSWQKPLLDLLLFFKALSVARSFQPQIIHAHLHEGAFIGILLKAILRIPLVMDFQGSLTVECRDHGFFKQGSSLEKFFAGIERKINASVDALIASSSAGAELLLQQWQVPQQKITAVIDGVDTDHFHPYPRAEVRQAFDIPDTSPLVVYLGVLNSYQGLDLLLLSIQILVAQGFNIHFLLMGYPEELYRKKAAELGLQKYVTFTGKIDYSDAARYLSAGDVAVSPKLSRTEANGKLFNYMACGLPTVVFDTPVNREILGEAGVYAAYGDAGDLARQIAALLNDPARLDELSRIGLEKSRNQHSWRGRAGSIIKIYGNLLEQ